MSLFGSIDRYEKGWMLVSGVILCFFFLAIGVSVFYGFTVPGHESHLDPSRVTTDAPFANPAIIQRAPGRYDAYIRAQIWSFVPNEIKVPAGSTVTFYMTTPDVMHGFMIERTNINVMALPGQVTKISARFDEPGEYRFFCHEYCGLGHHAMFGKLVVEPHS